MLLYWTNKAYLAVLLLAYAFQELHCCSFPEFFFEYGPWIFQYHQVRDETTGARQGITQYAQALVSSRTQRKEIIIRRYKIKAESKDPKTDIAIESVIQEEEELIRCFEHKKTRHSKIFVVEHVHYDKETKRQVKSGFMCLNIEPLTNIKTGKVFAATMYFGPVEPHQMKVAQCSRGETEDKWIITPYPVASKPKTVECPETFSYKVILSWVDPKGEVRNLRVNPDSSAGDQVKKPEHSVFTLMQSQCVYGTGISWLFYNTQVDIFNQLNIFSFRKKIEKVESVQINMQCGGHWKKHGYNFTLMFDPNNPFYMYTFRTKTVEDPATRYHIAHLYEGGVEVLSDGRGSNLRPTDGHLLSRKDQNHNRFELQYRLSKGVCDDLMKVCDNPTRLVEASRWDILMTYCPNYHTLGTGCLDTKKPVRCQYSQELVGKWLRIDENNLYTKPGMIEINTESIDSLTIDKWGSPDYPESKFYCLGKHGMAGQLELGKGSYETQKISDNQCTLSKSCFQFILPTVLMSKNGDSTYQNENLLFLRINHDKRLLSQGSPVSCTFNDDSIKLSDNSVVQGSYFNTLINNAIAKPVDQYQLQTLYKTPSPVHCDINLYHRYNFSLTKSWYPCLVQMMSPKGNSYVSFSMKFVAGSDKCKELFFVNREHNCLGGYAVLKEAVKKNTEEKQYKIIITYYLEGKVKNFNCWVVELDRQAVISKVFIFPSPQCPLLFSSQVKQQSSDNGEISAFLEHIDEKKATATFYNPMIYHREAGLPEIDKAEQSRPVFVSGLKDVSFQDGPEKEQQRPVNSPVSDKVWDNKSGVSVLHSVHVHFILIPLLTVFVCSIADQLNR